MYTLLLNDDNSLICSTKHVLMQRSSLVDIFHIVIPKMYGEIDMTDFTCTMEYVMPISKKYKTETLIGEAYKEDFIEYKIPLDSKLSQEAGDIELQLTFTKVELNDDGQKVQYVRHTQTANVPITPITAWSDIIPDEALSGLDNRILALDGQIKALNELQDSIIDKTPDDLVKTDDLIQLSKDGEPMGKGITILNIDNTDDILDGNNDGVIDIDKILSVEI